MQSNVKIKLISILFSIFIFSCADVYVQPDFDETEFNVSNLKNKKILIIFSKKIKVSEFIESVKSKFGTNDSCLKFITASIFDSLKTNLKVSSIYLGDSRYSNFSESSQPKAELIDVIKTTEEKINPEYLLVFSEFSVGNKKVTVDYVGSPGGPSTSEWCLIRYDVEIWDLKKRKKMGTFSNEGSRQVHMLFFETTMISAIENSVYHLVRYLKTGEITFSD